MCNVQLHLFLFHSYLQERVASLPLFGLTELGNVYVQKPQNPCLEAALGGHEVIFLQHYTSTVKALEEQVPLSTGPNLLSISPGTGYVGSSPRLAEVWQEVKKERTRLKLEEIAEPRFQLDARFEIVITDDDPSFLSSIRHGKVAELLVQDGLLVKVNTLLIIFLHASSIHPAIFLQSPHRSPKDGSQAMSFRNYYPWQWISWIRMSYVPG
jgi:hypothetical protein